MEEVKRIKLKCGTSMTGYLTDKVSKGAVIICPGGGYEGVSEREGIPVAKAFNEFGYHAFVLWYNVDKERRPLFNKPLRELGQGVSYLRENASKYDIQDKYIFVCGFSAGAHLAGSLGVLWNDAKRFEPGTDLEMQRPDAMILCYPVISSGEYAYRQGFIHLAGNDIEKQKEYSLEKLITKDTVPAFLWHTAEDSCVPVQNSVHFAEALIRNNIPVELHVFPFGVHGLSLATNEVEVPEDNIFKDEHVAQWMRLCVNWMELWRKDNAHI